MKKLILKAEETLIAYAKKYKCSDLCHYILSNPKFALWSGSAHKHVHHYGKGGLILHTTEVTKLAEVIAKNCGHTVNMEILITACIFHDYGKLEDYASDDKKLRNWHSTTHKYHIHHISRSALFFEECALKLNKPKAFKDAVLHCILSHHGFREWGSPVAPQTREAIILHEADNLSARLDDVDKPKPYFKK